MLVGGALGPGKPCLEPRLGPSKHPGPQEPPSSQGSTRLYEGSPQMIYGFDFDFDQSRLAQHLFCLSLSKLGFLFYHLQTANNK